MTQQQRSKKAWKKWQGLVSEQARSGQSVSAFCRERKLCAPHFYWWKKRLREADAAQRLPGGIGGEAGQFVEVQVAESAANLPGESRIEVRLRNGRSLMIGRGFDAEQVRALLAVVEAAG